MQGFKRFTGIAVKGVHHISVFSNAKVVSQLDQWLTGQLAARYRALLSMYIQRIDNYAGISSGLRDIRVNQLCIVMRSEED